MKKVLFATNNPAKIKRFKDALQAHDIDLISIKDLDENDKVKLNEDGKKLDKVEKDLLEEKIDTLHAKLEEIVKYIMVKIKEIHTTTELNKFLSDFNAQFNNENFLG